MAFLGLFEQRSEAPGCEVHARRTRFLWRLAVAIAIILVAILFGREPGG